MHLSTYMDNLLYVACLLCAYLFVYRTRGLGRFDDGSFDQFIDGSFDLFIDGEGLMTT